MIKWKNIVAWSVMMTMAVGFGHGTVSYASTGKVVINEVAWVGTPDNANDEWIELYNSSGVQVDLAGWVIVDDGSTTYKINQGVIAPYGYFLIADSSNVFSNVVPDAIIALSLANTGDSLELKNANGASVDMVDTGSKWFAGGGNDKASMERINPSVSGSDTDNWNSATVSNGIKGRSGENIIGTPGSVNSQYAGEGMRVRFDYSGVAGVGETITIPVVIDDAEALYAFAFDVIYDPEVLELVAVREGNFLKAGNTATAFQSGLENSIAGKLVVGNARLVNPPVGTDGSGLLFDLDFRIKESSATVTEVLFGAGSSLADVIGEVPAVFSSLSINVGEGAAPDFSGLEVKEGANRFELVLNWDGNADYYVVSKKNVYGEYEVLSQLSEKEYVDAFNIVPEIQYSYRVTAFLDGVSISEEIIGVETRGLNGDGDRNDRVNGKDIELLARAYGSQFGEASYNQLLDYNYDGFIDGNDLINIGANFGKKY